MTPLETFKAMQSNSVVKVTNKGYLEENGIVNNSFTISCIYSDDVVTLIDEEFNLFSEVYCKDIILTVI